MRDYGFQLRQLALTGPECEPAEIPFTSGLNVITGPSDTGKTFILQCIDYVLGAQDRPDEVPEAESYDTVVLVIEAVSDGRRYVLQRALRGGGILLTHPDGSEEQLRWKHSSARTDTISYFLLQLSGLEGKRVRTNALGETKDVSFRDLAHLAIISEQDVIRESSPVHSRSGYQQTRSRSVFRLLLSGMDDSSVVAVEEPRISRARVEAKTEVLQGMLGQLRNSIDEQQLIDGAATLRDQLDRINDSYLLIEGDLAATGNVMAEAEQRRQALWARIREIRARLDVMTGLAQRFSLLEQQYLSDLRRLDAIAEASSRLTEIGIERCPVCGALPEHHDYEHLDSPVDPEAVSASATAEATRIRSLIDDLNMTRQELTAESEELRVEQEDLQSQLGEVSATLQEQLRPRAQETTRALRLAATNRQEVRQSLDMIERAEALEAQIQEIQAEEVAAARQEFASVPIAAAEQFAQEVQARLAAWSFPDLDRVTFSDSDWDIVISGRPRTSHGKGVRAVTHAAFTTGLYRYCVQRRQPHPGFVLIDSPLVVYREPDPAVSTLDASVKSAFFADLASNFTSEQVILIENEEPPNAVSSSRSVNMVQFTKTDSGRYGFIPRD